jgi:hypothetical protein
VEVVVGRATLERRAERSIERRWATGAALLGAGLLVLVAYRWGSSLAARDPLMRVNAPPFVGTWAARWTPALAVPVALALAVVAAGPRLAHAMRWGTLVWTSLATAAGWAAALAWTGGPGALWRPLASRYEYLAAVSSVHTPAAFLGRFVDDLSAFPTHVRGHPPGTVLLFWALDRVGLGGPRWAALVVIAAGAAAVPAVLLAVRDLAGPAAARRLGPVLVLLPTAVWVATSTDALFLGVSAWAVALLVLATGASGRRATVLGGAGGALFAAALHLSYGSVLLVLLPVAVAVHRRRWRPLAVACLPVAVLTLTMGVLGFWWWDGLAATRQQYLAGVAARRPFSYFAVANLAALAVALGPAVVAGLARLRDGRLWVLCAAALAAVALADLSGWSKGEVERIWLPFAPWVAVAAAGARPGRGWLAATAGTGLALQVMLRTPW